MENLLIKRARLTPTRIGLSYGSDQWRFDELLTEAQGILNQLTTRLGHSPRRVAVFGRNHPDLYLTLLGLQLANSEIVVINNRLTSNEITEQLEISQPDCLLYASELCAKIPDYGQLPRFSFSELLEKEVTLATDLPKEKVSLDDTHTIMFTSGTTGVPKGVKQSFRNHLASAAGSAANLGMKASDKWLLVVPLFHISGYSMLMKGLIYGNEVVLVDRFDPHEVVAQMTRHHVTHMSLVPTMLLGLLATPGFKEYGKEMTAILLGGAAVSPELLSECHEAGLPIIQSFGMTETASQVVALNHTDSLGKQGSSGRPLKSVSLKISEAEKPGEIGEILILAANVTTGYLNSPLELTREGYFKTGDLGYLDSEGYLYVVGRQKELIISGGENIYPVEIEKHLLNHPAITEVAVTSEPDEQWGEKVVAYYTGQTLSDVAAITPFLEGLASYKQPKRYYQLAELPKNSLGKVLKQGLQSQVIISDLARD